MWELGENILAWPPFWTQLSPRVPALIGHRWQPAIDGADTVAVCQMLRSNKKNVLT